MDLGIVLKCLLFCFYNLSFNVVDADSRDVMTRGHLVANQHLTHIQEPDQHSLSEFSEDFTEKSKARKRKGRKKNKHKLSRKKKKSKRKRVTKIVKNANKKGPVDIIVHIKMNE